MRWQSPSQACCEQCFRMLQLVEQGFLEQEEPTGEDAKSESEHKMK